MVKFCILVTIPKGRMYTVYISNNTYAEKISYLQLKNLREYYSNYALQANVILK